MALITFRLPDSEKAAWQKLANRAGQTLSEWIRSQCEQAKQTCVHGKPKNKPCFQCKATAAAESFQSLK